MIGLRADAKQVYWAVVEGSQDSMIVVARDELSAPVTFGDAEALSWFRNQIHSVIFAHKPHVAAIRTPESTARGRGEGDRRRLRIEGVVMEAAYAKGLAVHSGALATIASKLGMKSARDAKGLQDDGGDLRGLDLRTLAKPLRECVLVAVAMLPPK